ncbi:RidA family protein [Herbiconiux sp.]|uniref:RidA family protein n=1 Tax=Herbiconiux sp. TaxID=1871186 RepID=UPI0025B7FBD5|nr:RidA family protein [Herbiconiux sp.]
MSIEDRVNYSSGSPWEPVLGYSRAVKVGDLLFIAGTSSGGIGETAEEQTREIFRRLESALTEAGAGFANVVRTRIYLTDIADFDAVGRVHGEIFGEIRPVTAAVGVTALASPELLVEIEVDAVL